MTFPLGGFGGPEKDQVVFLAALLMFSLPRFFSPAVCLGIMVTHLHEEHTSLYPQIVGQHMLLPPPIMHLLLLVTPSSDIPHTVHPVLSLKPDDQKEPF